MKHLLYFGCNGRDLGHHLWVNQHEWCSDYWLRENLPSVNESIMRADGIFTPGGIGEAQGIYRESIVPPLRIVAWWDRSRDKRFASNSFLAGYGYDSAEAMLDDAVNLYPEVMSRQTRPVPDKVSV